jgi:hypothetical protein
MLLLLLLLLLPPLFTAGSAAAVEVLVSSSTGIDDTSLTVEEGGGSVESPFAGISSGAAGTSSMDDPTNKVVGTIEDRKLEGNIVIMGKDSDVLVVLVVVVGTVTPNASVVTMIIVAVRRLPKFMDSKRSAAVDVTILNVGSSMMYNRKVCLDNINVYVSTLQ